MTLTSFFIIKDFHLFSFFLFPYQYTNAAALNMLHYLWCKARPWPCHKIISKRFAFSIINEERKEVACKHLFKEKTSTKNQSLSLAKQHKNESKIKRTFITSSF